MASLGAGSLDRTLNGIAVSSGMPDMQLQLDGGSLQVGAGYATRYTGKGKRQRSAPASRKVEGISDDDATPLIVRPSARTACMTFLASSAVIAKHSNLARPRE